MAGFPHGASGQFELGQEGVHYVQGEFIQIVSCILYILFIYVYNEGDEI